MSSQGVGSRKSSTAAPLATSFQIPFANKLFLSRMQTFVSLSVVLSSKRLATDRTYERSLIGVGA